MENYYQRNMDRLECDRRAGVQYNQLLDLTYDEGSSAPTEPVTLEEVKAFSAIDIDEDDALIEALIPAARQICESFTNIGFINRTVTAVFNNGNGGFYLPMGPVTSAPTAEDSEGEELDATYGNNTWKQVLSPRDERMSCTYEAGYAELPAQLKTALLNQVRYLYDNRAEGKTDISPIALMILNPLRRVW